MMNRVALVLVLAAVGVSACGTDALNEPFLGSFGVTGQWACDVSAGGVVPPGEFLIVTDKSDFVTDGIRVAFSTRAQTYDGHAEPSGGLVIVSSFSGPGSYLGSGALTSTGFVFQVTEEAETEECTYGFTATRQ